MKRTWLKLFAAVLSLLLAFSLCACVEEEGEENENVGGVSRENSSAGNTSDGTESEGTPSPSLEKNGDGLYMIYTAEDMVLYRSIVEEKMKADVVEAPRNIPEFTEGIILMADIDMSSVCGPDKDSWRPIGTDIDPNRPQIAGNCLITVDGNGHSISGLYAKSTEIGGGLFASLQNSVVKDLTFKNSTLECKYGAGGEQPLGYYGTGVIAMRIDRTEITNCKTESDVSVSGMYSVGGLVGVADEGGNKFEKCVNHGTVTALDGYAGGIVGQTVQSTDLFYCDNYGTINGDGSLAGGIVGRASGDSHYAGDIMGCVNYGTIVNVQEGPNTVGGIAGYNNSTIYFCINMGTVQANGGAGYDITDDNDGAMKWCINTGKVLGARFDDKYAYVSEARGNEGFNLSPDDPALTDGSLLAEDKLGSYYWTQGEKFPVWNGTMP